MSTNFPGALDSLTNPVPSDGLTGHASQHANANDAIEALQAKVGINSSGDTNSLDYKINHLTKAQVGLGNVDNTSDINKPVSTAQAAADSAVQTAAASDATTKANAAQAAAIAASIPLSQKGTANGVAPLDGTGKVSSTYLPSYVDDVVESATYAALPATGETGKIYVVIADETHSGATTQYRWTGSAYAIITSSPGSTDAVPEGSTNLYFTYQRVRDTVLTGLSTATNALISATDSVLVALGKLQAQISGISSAAMTLTNKTIAAASNTVESTSAPGATQFSHRNKIINGAFAINQRAYVSSAATADGQYTLDRWKVTGTGGIAFSAVNNKTTVTIPAGQKLQQVIEGLNLATGTYVLSWEGTAQGRIYGGSYGASGTVTASITGGTNTTIEFNAGTVANVQLELGTIATPFEHRPYGAELALCKRYYEIGRYSQAGYSSYGTKSSRPFMVEKRATPTMTISNIDYSGFGATSAIAIAYSTREFEGSADWTATAAYRSVAFDWQAFADL